DPVRCEWGLLAPLRNRMAVNGMTCQRKAAVARPFRQFWFNPPAVSVETQDANRLTLPLGKHPGIAIPDQVEMDIECVRLEGIPFQSDLGFEGGGRRNVTGESTGPPDDPDRAVGADEISSGKDAAVSTHGDP